MTHPEGRGGECKMSRAPLKEMWVVEANKLAKISISRLPRTYWPKLSSRTHVGLEVSEDTRCNRHELINIY